MSEGMLSEEKIVSQVNEMIEDIKFFKNPNYWNLAPIKLKPLMEIENFAELEVRVRAQVLKDLAKTV
jgi:hypothetical protein